MLVGLTVDSPPIFLTHFDLVEQKKTMNGKTTKNEHKIEQLKMKNFIFIFLLIFTVLEKK